MDFHKKSLLNYLKNILSIPSPTGFTYNVTDYIKKELDILDIPYTVTNKGALIITLEGTNRSYERTLSSHVDTLGAMVKEIKDNGSLSIVPIGGYMMNSIEGENCTVHTLNDEVYTGTIQTIKPSVHIHGDDSKTLKRSPINMEVIIDEKVFSKSDVEKLNINVGDFICFDTRTLFTEKNFIKSRHLDDKAGTAILLYAIKYIAKNNLTLPYTTNFLISNYEEVGHGASYIPNNTREFISVDMGAPGKGQNSSEYSVCICAKDSSGPYDLELKKRLINICKTSNIPYKIDIYPHYGSDASAALRAGWDIKTALIGPGVYSSHAYERTHIEAILATFDLIIKYCVS
ncbi:M42 family metallopeptidase [Clostridium niameyense]|uniref:M42 family metallopeptidase n=1 Tax=Clostridium niameyense TaxID=1622073 RepID=A0A6M0RD09_9CLOT|nr:M42 family metallopeptidase [Clostridium niameyense]NEZ47098.1 M42 family metallopeptidase [Clostridium niameyense]